MIAYAMAEPFRQHALLMRDMYAQIAGSWAYRAFSPIYDTATKAIPFDELKVGMGIELEKTIAECDLYYFISVSGDVNAIHLYDYNRVAIAHGMISESAISKGLSLLPGPGTLIGDKYARFHAPVYVGDKVKLKMWITELKRKPAPKFHQVKVEAEWFNQKGELVISGWSNAFVPNVSTVENVVSITKAA